MNTNKNERNIEVTYANTDSMNIATILDAIYEVTGLLYAEKPVSDAAVA